MSIPYEQLTFTNQFMFEKVLTRPENKNIVRRIIEMAIGEEVEDIQLVQSENSIQIYEYSVRREPLSYSGNRAPLHIVRSDIENSYE